jgi:hypothetical protein
MNIKSCMTTHIGVYNHSAKFEIAVAGIKKLYQYYKYFKRVDINVREN